MKEERQVNIYELSGEISALKYGIENPKDRYYRLRYDDIRGKYYDFVKYCNTRKAVLERLESLFSYVKIKRLNKFDYCKAKI